MQNIYKIELEVFESEGCNAHRVGDRFNYPADSGRICHWLLDSAGGMIRVLTFGGRLPWSYAGTPYEKSIDPEGVTTEFVRCPDPTAKVVLKITRRKIGEVGPDGKPAFLLPEQ